MSLHNIKINMSWSREQLYVYARKYSLGILWNRIDNSTGNIDCKLQGYKTEIKPFFDELIDTNQPFEEWLQEVSGLHKFRQHEAFIDRQTTIMTREIPTRPGTYWKLDLFSRDPHKGTRHRRKTRLFVRDNILISNDHFRSVQEECSRRTIFWKRIN